MISIAVLVALVVAIGMAVVSRSHPRSSLGEELTRWTEAGLISTDQAREIGRFEAAAHPLPPPVAVSTETAAASMPATLPVQPTTPPRSWRLAEAIGYLGGVLAAVGVALLAARYWPDLGAGARVSITATGAVLVLLGAGLVDESLSAALTRLRWFLWLLATALLGTTAGVVMHDLVETRHVPSIAAAVATTVALASLALWRNRERPVQQFTAMAAMPIALGVFVSDHLSTTVGGLAVLALGAAVCSATLAHRLNVTLVALLTSTITGTVGAIMVMSQHQGLGGLLALAWVAVLLWLAVSRTTTVHPLAERRLLGAVGCFTSLQVLAPTIGYYAEHAQVSTGFTVTLVGAGIIALGVADLTVFRTLTVVAGGVPLLGGAAIASIDLRAVGPIIGVGLALGLVVAGIQWPQLPFTILGSLGLLVFVPWAIGHFFPGEGQAAIVTLVAGATLLAVALLLLRNSRSGRGPASRHGFHGV